MKARCKRIWFLLVIFIQVFALQASSQDIDSLLSIHAEDSSRSNKTIYTFKSTRVSNGHSVETLPAGILDVKIQHRFGYLSGGWEQFFGLDNATVRIGGDYGITDRLMIGGGRASFGKQWDGFIKYKLLAQQSGQKNIPLSVSLLSSVMLQTLKKPDSILGKQQFSDRLFYGFQAILARKFNDNFSLQLVPTLVHYNIVPRASDPNDIVSIGVGVSTKITQRASLIVEYYYNLPGYKFAHTKNSLAIGFDIETAGHVFQVAFTNAQGIAERPFISETTGSFFDGDISLGFNVSRSFQLVKRKKSAPAW